MKIRMSLRIVLGSAGFAAVIATALAWLDHVFPPDLSKLHDQAVVVVDRDGQLLQAFTARDGRWRLPVAADDVDARYLRMLIAYEDKRFYSHFGVDTLAVLRALSQWVAHGRIVSGASTLTMQTARLLEPRGRTIRSKIVEMMRAVQLETRFSKRQILEMYLTLAPFGGNIEGVRAASLFYFGKEPRRLTDAEAALLVALPQSPENLRPDRHNAGPENLRPDRHNAAARVRRDLILARLIDAGELTAKQRAEAVQQIVPVDRLPAIRSAPHLAERLHAAHPLQSSVRSLVDASLQRQLEVLARRRQATLEDAATLAILVVENRDRQVRAYIGSGDYFDDRRFGQNDMVTAIRSPGSTLKPFIYGLAFDELVVHPETLLVDQPMRFGDYAPENFDHFYRGEVTAREALQLSLNLPAVAILYRLGPVRFANALKSAGASLRLPAELSNPGLPIALGGAGATLEDLVMLYAGLADGGRMRPLQFSELDLDHSVTPLMGEVAAWYLTSVLQDSPPPPNAIAMRHRKESDPIAFKTGTSYGFRDAWAIGYDDSYTVGIWVGRPDGSFSPDRMGRDAAAPLLFEVFDMLPQATTTIRRNAAPPAGAIVASNAELPLALRRFDDGLGRSATLKSDKDRPHIEFPRPDAILDLERTDGGYATLTLRAAGGELPLRWLVNGRLIASLPYKRQANWQPDGVGATRITVMDRAGSSYSVDVWLE